MSTFRAPLLAGLVSVLLLVGFWFLLWQPQREDRQELEDEIAQLQAQQQRLRLDIERLEEIQRNELAIRAELARLEEFIPTGTAQPTAIRQFQLTADAAGVVIESVSFSDPVAIEDAPETALPDTVLARISMTMRIEGGYFQVVDFLRRVEATMPRAVLVHSLAMVEGTLGFPSLLTTWNADLFAVVPVAQAQTEQRTPPGEPEEPEDEAVAAPEGARR